MTVHITLCVALPHTINNNNYNYYYYGLQFIYLNIKFLSNKT